MDIKNILDTYSSSEIGEEIAKLAADNSDDSISNLALFLEIRDSHTYDKHVIPYLACRGLLFKGRDGLDKLVEVLDKIEGHIYPQAIIESIWMASTGKLPDVMFNHIPILPPLDFSLSEEIVSLAKDAFLGFVLRSHTDPESFYRLVNFMHGQTFKSAISEHDYSQFHRQIFNILSDSAIKISQEVITSFIDLVDSEGKEESYQIFIENNPVILDPLATKVVEKHRLGDDYITDFVIETLRGDYLLVEIEKPQDQIFNQSGNFSSKFSHALGQVLDFIEWIESNIAYADKKLPGVSSPKGIVIMGRRKQMTAAMEKKLRRFNRNSNAIEVLTYDDLIDRAKSLYMNIRKQIGL